MSKDAIFFLVWAWIMVFIASSGFVLIHDYFKEYSLPEKIVIVMLWPLSLLIAMAVGMIRLKTRFISRVVKLDE